MSLGVFTNRSTVFVSTSLISPDVMFIVHTQLFLMFSYQRLTCTYLPLDFLFIVVYLFLQVMLHTIFLCLVHL